MKITLTALFLVAAFFSQAQEEYLYFKKKGTAKIKRLSLYQSIGLRDTATGKWVSGRVTYFTDTTIQLDHEKMYKFSQLDAVRFGKNSLKFLSGAGYAGGAILGGVVLINGGLNGDSWESMRGSLAIAAGMAAAGYVFEWLSKRPYLLEKYRLEHIKIE